MKNRAVLVKGKLLRSTSHSAGYDMFSDSDVLIRPGHSAEIGTGVEIRIQEGYEGQVRTKSGLNFKQCLVVPTGTIDADYHDEIKVKIYNHSQVHQKIIYGQKIAQLVISEVFGIEGAEVLEEKRKGGFGSTGL